ncbi:MAG: hypothetical protein A2270_06855 [Elusimicrobia bacterium RIFOXYA12_FULL_51_18]|nr:MAG: hypothetical protein A2270_06855 [Elusimicrobia bacterium RIFOXYA12_FULL_51_18]OGS28405.1 MAG: hypothetical protein A2218_05160 [Elusimicrobia bacterium RIFOXYA2_FULL_53_38]
MQCVYDTVLSVIKKIDISELFSFVFSAIAISFSIYTYSKSRGIALYQDIDRLYLELLKLGMENPRFLNPQLTCNYQQSFCSDELYRYKAYAFIAWNICETISDRRNDTELFKTWLPVLKVENNLHRAWFDAEENREKFKKEFQDFVKESFPHHSK